MSDFNKSNVGFQQVGCRILTSRMSDVGCRISDFNKSNVGFQQVGYRMFTSRMSDAGCRMPDFESRTSDGTYKLP